MLKAWEISNHRATLILTFLGKTSNSIQNLQEIINDICNIELISDGINYETTHYEYLQMQVNGEYHGLRALFKASMHSANIHMQIDIGFSDVIFPEPNDHLLSYNFGISCLQSCKVIHLKV